MEQWPQLFQNGPFLVAQGILFNFVFIDSSGAETGDGHTFFPGPIKGHDVGIPASGHDFDGFAWLDFSCLQQSKSANVF